MTLNAQFYIQGRGGRGLEGLTEFPDVRVLPGGRAGDGESVGRGVDLASELALPGQAHVGADPLAGLPGQAAAHPDPEGVGGLETRPIAGGEGDIVSTRRVWKHWTWRSREAESVRFQR
jgi:hypothetical protein